MITLDYEIIIGAGQQNGSGKRMAAIKNYSNLIDGIFGVGTTKFSTAATHSNNVIGALDNVLQFKEFTANYTERLQRLMKIYSAHPNYMKDNAVVQYHDVYG